MSTTPTPKPELVAQWATENGDDWSHTLAEDKQLLIRIAELAAAWGAEQATQSTHIAAVKTLERLRYTYHGAEFWKPPLGQRWQEFEFGEYVTVEQKRYGVPNEWFVHKVVGMLESNSWVDVPAEAGIGPTLHDTTEPVVQVICCGIDESKVVRYRAADCKMHRAAQPALPPGYVVETKCSEHPDAPHGFNRNASHTNHRYTCDCEGWQPDSEPTGETK